MTKSGPTVYRWPDPQQRDFSQEKLGSRELQLDSLYRCYIIRRNIRAEYHNELQVHVHHHKLLNYQSPESPRCGDIFQSLHAFVQNLMAEHYDQRTLNAQYERIEKGCELKLDFLLSEVHAMSLYDPKVTLNAQVPRMGSCLLCHKAPAQHPQEQAEGKRTIDLRQVHLNMCECK